MSSPEKKFRCGPVTANIWSSSKCIEGEMVKFYAIKIDKTYPEENDWKHTFSFSAEDLPKVALVANEAYKYIRLISLNVDEEPESS